MSRRRGWNREVGHAVADRDFFELSRLFEEVMGVLFAVVIEHFDSEHSAESAGRGRIQLPPVPPWAWRCGQASERSGGVVPKVGGRGERIEQRRRYNKPLQQTARPSTALRAAPVRPQLKGVVFDERRTSCARRPGRDAGARRHGRRRARCAQPHRRPWRRRERDVLGLASGLARKGRAGR